MGAGPDPRVVKRALRRAEVVAEEHTKRTGTPCRARLIRASNGEAAIVYDILNVHGNVSSFLSLPKTNNGEKL